MIEEVHIIKRDGKREPFSIDKIRSAITKAFISVGSFATQESMINILSRLNIYDGIHEEEIQNQVERSLMAERYYEVAADDDWFGQHRQGIVGRGGLFCEDVELGVSLWVLECIGEMNVVGLGHLVFPSPEVDIERFGGFGAFDFDLQGEVFILECGEVIVLDFKGVGGGLGVKFVVVDNSFGRLCEDFASYRKDDNT